LGDEPPLCGVEDVDCTRAWMRHEQHAIREHGVFKARLTGNFHDGELA
jgi:hypothetical protein